MVAELCLFVGRLRWRVLFAEKLGHVEVLDLYQINQCLLSRLKRFPYLSRKQQSDNKIVTALELLSSLDLLEKRCFLMFEKKIALKIMRSDINDD